MKPLIAAGLLPLKFLPIALLIVFAGLTALIGLAARTEGRRYASQIFDTALAAACALGAGERLELRSARRSPTKRVLATTNDQ